MNDENIRQAPQSELDLNLMLTNSIWGRPDIANDLKDRLSTYFLPKDTNGNPILSPDNKILVEKNSSWVLLGIYTRDMRLANLNPNDNELQRTRDLIDLAADFIQETDLQPSFLKAISMAATILETSQSKKGWLRTNQNTLRQEHYMQNVEPPRKSLMGKKPDMGGNY